MPKPMTWDDDEQIIADLQREVRRLQARVATTRVEGYADSFTAAATPATTYALTYIALDGTCEMALNDAVLIEGVDYTPDYATGLVTVAHAQSAGDKVVFRYLVTDWLKARSLPEETDAARIVQTAIGGGGGTGITATFGAAPAVGNVIVAVVSKYNPRTFVPNPGAGWTQQLGGSGVVTQGNASVEVFIRVVQSGDGATWTFDEGFGFTDAFTVGLFEIAASDGTPSGWTYTTHGVSSSPLSQSITGTAGQLLVVGCCPNGGSTFGGLTTMTPSGYTDDRHHIEAGNSLIIGHVTATGTAQSIGTSWDGSNGDCIQVVIAVTAP